MRPQQQNRRMRGRNNNNNNNGNNRGKGGNQNPLARSYESNGPDVKIRGNAQQIAEKYTTLARDAMSSGDRVMAENYLQHAEHYNRIIAAYQAQLPNQNMQQNREDFDDEDVEDGEFERQGFESGQPSVNGNGPQPVIEGVPAEIALNGESNGNPAPREQNGREERREFRGRRDRNRDFQNRNGNGDYQRRDAQQGEAQDDTNVSDSLPAFLTNGAPQPVAAAEPSTPVEAAPAAETPRRTRRPRRGESAAEAPDASSGEATVVSTTAAEQPKTGAFATSDE